MKTQPFLVIVRHRKNSSQTVRAQCPTAKKAAKRAEELIASDGQLTEIFIARFFRGQARCPAKRPRSADSCGRLFLRFRRKEYCSTNCQQREKQRRYRRQSRGSHE